MKHLKIETILEKRIEKIDAALVNVRLQLQPEEIRVFRIKIKKLGAFLRLMNGAKGHGHAAKLPPKMVKIYQLLGAVRTVQLQQSYVQKTGSGQPGSPDTYLAYLDDQLQQYSAEVLQQLKGLKPLKKAAEKILKLLPKQISRAAILQFIHLEGDALAELFTPVFPSDKSFHEARKLLMNLLHISPYLDMQIKEISPYTALATYEDIRELTVLLGDFQELHTVIDSLRAAVSKIEIEDSEKNLLRGLEVLWIKDRESLRGRIYDELYKITASGRTTKHPVELQVT
jgi:hypothetical protein